MVNFRIKLKRWSTLGNYDFALSYLLWRSKYKGICNPKPTLCINSIESLISPILDRYKIMNCKGLLLYLNVNSNLSVKTGRTIKFRSEMDSNKKNLLNEIAEWKSRLNKEMPRIKREIQIYEEKVAFGMQTKNPKPSPQFGNV